MSTAPSRGLTIIGRSDTGLPRTFGVDQSGAPAHEPTINAAYRRLAATIVGVDVPTLAGALRRARLMSFHRAAA
jgi:hypothetical protein